MDTTIFSSFAIILLAALIHASFQLSVSVLTLLSGHSLGKKTAHRRVMRLAGGFVLGVIVFTKSCLLALLYSMAILYALHPDTIILCTAISCGLMIGLGIAVWAFYYRRAGGTSLWLPRPFALYLTKRTQKTKNTVEAFSLGMTSVFAELIFIIAPLLVASIFIIFLPSVELSIVAIFAYILLSSLPLLIIFALISGGHNVARLQQWREKHKRFLQFIAGSSLLVLAVFIFVDQLLPLLVAKGLWL